MNRDTARYAIVASLALGALACGAASSSARLSRLFDGDRAATARESFPSQYARAEEARDRALAAENAGDVEVADDHATAARLWLAAAIAETEAVELGRQTSDVNAEADAAERLAAERESLRHGIVDRAARRRAALVATAEAQRSFEHAQGYEARRLRRDDQETRQLWRRSTRSLLRRASLLLAAAEQLGAPEPRVRALRTRREQLQGRPRLELVVGEANELVRESQQLLGRARAEVGGPSDAERDALFEAARDRGLTIERTERGVELTSAALARPTAALVTQLAGVLQAHRHGPVLLVGTARTEEAGLTAANTLRERLSASGVPGNRMRSSGLTSAASRTVFVVLTAY